MDIKTRNVKTPGSGVDHPESTQGPSVPACLVFGQLKNRAQADEGEVILYDEEAGRPDSTERLRGLLQALPKGWLATNAEGLCAVHAD